jgi:hypothetical protein
MSILKDLYCEAYEQLLAEAEERGEFVDENKLADAAAKKANNMLYDMCDAAKDRAKYNN